MAYDQETASRVRRLLRTRTGIAEKEMMGGLAFLVNGHIACSVSGRGGMLVRVGAGAMERLLEAPHVRPAVMGARTMTGFVRLDPEAYRSDAALREWIRRGADLAAALPAEPLRRRGPSRRRRGPG